MSRVNFGSKPLVYPMPVLIIASYDKDGNPNAMNAAWGGITDNNIISIALSSHKTTDNILERKAFTISMATEDYVKACDYVGVVSANKVSNKFEKAGFTAEKSQNVDAPIIKELPMTLECRLIDYENEVLRGEIVNVCAEETILTDGKIDPAKLKPITYDPCNHKYIALGKIVGDAFTTKEM